MSKQYVQMLADGTRGPGGFPAPVRWVDAKTRLWLWADVAEWMQTRLGRTSTAAGDAHTIPAFNGLLEVRRHIPQLRSDEGDELAEFIREDDELRALLDA